MMKWNKSQCLQENYLQMLLPLLQVPQQRLTKVSTQQGMSVWPMCSLPQGEWESPAPVEQQEYIVRSKETQRVTTMPIFNYFFNRLLQISLVWLRCGALCIWEKMYKIKVNSSVSVKKSRPVTQNNNPQTLFWAVLYKNFFLSNDLHCATMRKELS